jgi:hypothetical protein
MSAQHERFEADREDLLGEATALVDRVELAVEGFADPVVVGFRRQGGASVYFGADPAYHFNSAGELRRAYCGGLLYRADGGRLASLERRRNDGEVELVRREIGEDDQQAFLDRLARELAALRNALDAGGFTVRGQVSTSGDVMPKVLAWLARLNSPVAMAQKPNVA